MSDLLFFLRDYDFFIRSDAARHKRVCYRQPIGKIRKAYKALREALTRNDLVEAGVQLEYITAGDVGAYLGDFIREFWKLVPDEAAREIIRRAYVEVYGEPCPASF